MKIRLSALVSACALAYPFAALAQASDAQLGHVVVTATRQPISADQALASVDVIERDEIARAGHSTLLTLLASRPGVQMARNGGPGATGSIFIRGANSPTRFVEQPHQCLSHISQTTTAVLVGAQSAATIRRKAEWLLHKAEGKGLWSRLFG